jgi:hypothetical protein
LVAAFSLVAVTTVVAEEGDDKGPGHHGKKFGDLFADGDKNGDQKISFDEFKSAHEARIEKHFKHLDSDGDGYVTKAESEAAREKMHERRANFRERRQENKGDLE